MSNAFISVSEIPFNGDIYEIQPPVNVPESMHQSLTLARLVGFALANARGTDPESIGYIPCVDSIASQLDGEAMSEFPVAALEVSRSLLKKADHILTKKS